MSELPGWFSAEDLSQRKVPIYVGTGAGRVIWGSVVVISSGAWLCHCEDDSARMARWLPPIHERAAQKLDRLLKICPARLLFLLGNITGPHAPALLHLTDEMLEETAQKLKMSADVRLHLSWRRANEGRWLWSGRGVLRLPRHSSHALRLLAATATLWRGLSPRTRLPLARPDDHAIGWPRRALPLEGGAQRSFGVQTGGFSASPRHTRSIASPCPSFAGTRMPEVA